MRMTLAPGEVFEHTHHYHSVTMLLEGSVDLLMGGTRTSMQPGVPVAVDANVPHTMVNVGRGVAALECVHKQGDPPPA
jgi:mannose-6-phosphate isomerase-like protein (cupin superfamily)